MNDQDLRGPPGEGDGVTMMSPVSSQQLLELWEQRRKSTLCWAKRGAGHGEVRDFLEGGYPSRVLAQKQLHMPARSLQE